MSKYEVNQVWSNEHNQATITNVATSYNDTYIRYTIEGKQFEMNEHTFGLSFPQAVLPVVEKATTPTTVAKK